MIVFCVNRCTWTHVAPRTWLRLSRKCLLSSWCVFQYETFFGEQIVVSTRSSVARSSGLPISRWFDWWLWSLPCQAVNSDSEVVLRLTRHDDPCLSTNEVSHCLFVVAGQIWSKSVCVIRFIPSWTLREDQVHSRGQAGISVAREFHLSLRITSAKTGTSSRSATNATM